VIDLASPNWHLDVMVVRIAIGGVPSITKARSSTISARYDSLIAVPATISKVPTKAHMPAV
jgi:hypothetical protein